MHPAEPQNAMTPARAMRFQPEVTANPDSGRRDAFARVRADEVHRVKSHPRRHRAGEPRVPPHLDRSAIVASLETAKAAGSRLQEPAVAIILLPKDRRQA